ncbi:MAG: hypothetical protein ACJ70S_04650, partial [Nitrososphaera sp.]
SSECSLDRTFGGSGNDEIQQPGDFTRAGDGNDIINFFDCCGTAYGNDGDDRINGGDAGIEAHGGDGDNDLFGDSGNDKLTGGENGENHFDCGSGDDTITNFDPGTDTKTSDCEHF